MACKLTDSKEKKEEGLERLRTIAGKLESSKGGDDHNMLNKITAKLKILETLANR